MIGLIGAMTVEVELIKDNMTEKREETISGITFVQGKLEGVDCVAADYQYRCGRRYGERN